LIDETGDRNWNGPAVLLCWMEEEEEATELIQLFDIPQAMDGGGGRTRFPFNNPPEECQGGAAQGG